MLVNGVEELRTKISNQCHPVLRSAAKLVTLMQRTISLFSTAWYEITGKPVLYISQTKLVLVLWRWN